MPCFHTCIQLLVLLTYLTLPQQNNTPNPVGSSVIVYRFDDNVVSLIEVDSGLPKHGRRYYYYYYLPYY